VGKANRVNLDDFVHFDPVFAKKLEPFLRGLYDFYFRCEVTGWENIPEGQALFVGNHNGLLTFEVLMIFYAWWKKFGTSKKALALAHGIALQHPFKWLIPKLGAVPASPEIALEALKRNYSLMVYPGGEKESFRPYKERKKLDFYQRKGFIRIALQSKVPIVPIVSIGAHETYFILNRGEKLAEKLGLKKSMRLHGLPITLRSLFFFWCLTTGIFTFFPLLLAPSALASIFIPMPAKMKFVILPAIDVHAMLDDRLTEEENIQKIYDYIVTSMQTVLTKEYEKRKYPIIG